MGISDVYIKPSERDDRRCGRMMAVLIVGRECDHFVDRLMAIEHRRRVTILKRVSNGFLWVGLASGSKAS